MLETLILVSRLFGADLQEEAQPPPDDAAEGRWLSPDARGLAAAPSPRQAASLSLPASGPIDLAEPRAVLAHVFANLPPQVDVLPTENYLYWRFHSPQAYVWGNLRLAPRFREKGILHIGYYEFREEITGPEDANAQYTALGPQDGIRIDREDDFHWNVTYAGKTVAFVLNDISQAPPAKFSIGDREEYLFRLQDESTFRFFLLFDHDDLQFRYVLDEEAGADPRIVEIGDDLAVDLGSGFLFWIDRARDDRKVLIGVYRRNITQNNYYDGPADQLADNYIPQAKGYLEAVHLAYPFTRGQLDEYGFYLRDADNRIAIAPYYAYSTLEEMRTMVRTCRQRQGDRELLLCLNPGAPAGGDVGAAAAFEPLAPLSPLPAAQPLPPATFDAAVVDEGETVPDATRAVTLFETWEAGLNGWTQNGLWHILFSPPTSCPPGPVVVSGTRSAYYGINGTCNYALGPSHFGTLTSPPIGPLPAGSVLSFQYRRQTEGACRMYDRSQVQISSGGGPFTVLLELCDDTNVWKDSGQIDLSAYAGSTIRIRFLFDSIDNGRNGFLGWLIDDVRIGDGFPIAGPNPRHLFGVTWHFLPVTWPPPPPPRHLFGVTWHFNPVTWPPPPPKPPPGHRLLWTWPPPGGPNPPEPPPHITGQTWHYAGVTWPPGGAIHNSGFTWHYEPYTFIPAGTKHNSGVTWHYEPHTFIPEGTIHNSGVTWHYEPHTFIPAGTIHNSGFTWHYDPVTFIPAGTKHNSGFTWHVGGVTFIPPGTIHNSGFTWHFTGQTFIPAGTKHNSGVTWHYNPHTFIPPGTIHNSGVTWHYNPHTFIPAGTKHNSGSTWHFSGQTFIPPGTKHNSGSTWHYNPHTFIPAGTIHNSGFTWHYGGVTFIPAGTKHNSGFTWHYAGQTFIPPGTIHNSGVTWHFGGVSFIPAGSKHNSGVTWHVAGQTFIPPNARHMAGGTWHDPGGSFLLANVQSCTVPGDCEVRMCAVASCNPEDNTCHYQATPGAPCDDDDPHSFSDQCTVEADCRGQTPPGSPCDDDNDCTFNDVHTTSGCQGTPNPGSPCDDGNHCTVGDTCDAGGTCQGLSTGGSCEDADDCSDLDVCNASGGCGGSFVPQCDDQDVCNGSESCDPDGGCQPTTAPPCGDVCSGEGTACNPGVGCNLIASAQCGGANSCFDTECSSTDGGCILTPKSCDDGNPCTTDTCGPGGICQQGILADGTVCDDTNACTSNDACQAGACVGTTTSCSPCTVCDAQDGLCKPAAEGAACGGPGSCCGGPGFEGVCVPNKCTLNTPPEVNGLRLSKTGTPGNVLFQWNPVPFAGSGYALYEGRLDGLYNSLECMAPRAPSTSATRTTASGNRYYLVRAVNDSAAAAGQPIEGPLGTTTGGAQRTPAALACDPMP